MAGVEQQCHGPPVPGVGISGAHRAPGACTNARDPRAPRATRKVTRGGKTFTMRTGRIGTAARAKAPAAPSAAPRPALTAPVMPFASGGADTQDVSASVSSMASKIDTAADGIPQPSQEHTSLPSVAPATTAVLSHPEPRIPPPQPSLIDVWQADQRRRTESVRGQVPRRALPPPCRP
jgi:hypothetical protein